jgi:hypothetical protein
MWVWRQTLAHILNDTTSVVSVLAYASRTSTRSSNAFLDSLIWLPAGDDVEGDAVVVVVGTEMLLAARLLDRDAVLGGVVEPDAW